MTSGNITVSAEYIVLDIETYRTRAPHLVERIAQEAAEKEPPKTASKAVLADWFTESARNERIREALDKTAVDPMCAEILCAVASLDSNDPRAFSGNEFDLLARFAAYLDDSVNEHTVWVGHNIAGFDLPVLLNRFRRYGIRPPEHFPVFDDGRWHGRIYDTMRRTPGKTPYISMEAACEVAGIELPVVLWQGERMHGGRVAACYDSGDLATLIEYCTADVVATRSLYNAMTFDRRWGTYPGAGNLLEAIREIEENSDLSEASKALAQKSALKAAGRWPR